MESKLYRFIKGLNNIMIMDICLAYSSNTETTYFVFPGIIQFLWISSSPCIYKEVVFSENKIAVTSGEREEGRHKIGVGD